MSKVSLGRRSLSGCCKGFCRDISETAIHKVFLVKPLAKRCKLNPASGHMSSCGLCSPALLSLAWLLFFIPGAWISAPSCCYFWKWRRTCISLQSSCVYLNSGKTWPPPTYDFIPLFIQFIIVYCLANTKPYKQYQHCGSFTFFRNKPRIKISSDEFI